jgi:hypothetical protein
MTLLDPLTTKDPNFQGKSPATKTAYLTLTFDAGTAVSMSSTAMNMVLDLSLSTSTQAKPAKITLEVDFSVPSETEIFLAINKIYALRQYSLNFKSTHRFI